MSSRNTALVNAESNIILARSPCGTERTHCRMGTRGITRSISWAAKSLMRRPIQLRESSTPTRKRDRAAPPAVPNSGQNQAVRKDPAAQEGLHLGHDERGQHGRPGNRFQLAYAVFQCACSVEYTVCRVPVSPSPPLSKYV